MDLNKLLMRERGQIAKYQSFIFSLSTANLKSIPNSQEKRVYMLITYCVPPTPLMMVPLLLRLLLHYYYTITTSAGENYRHK